MTFKRGLILILLLCVPAAADNGVPWKISYQGVLNQNGTPVNNAALPMQFELHTDATANTLVWSSATTVNVSNGAFSVILGDAVNPISTGTVAGGVLFLQITVGNSTLLPREEITPALYALRAGSLEGLTIDSGGSLGIGVQPAARLDLGEGAILISTITAPANPTDPGAVLFLNTRSGAPCAAGESQNQLMVRFHVGPDVTLRQSGCFQ